MRFSPPSTYRVLAELSRSTVLRLLRAVRIAQNRRANDGQGRRQPTARKGGDGLLILLLLLLAPLFLVQSTFMASRAASGLRAASVASADPAAEPLVVPRGLYRALDNGGLTESAVVDVLDRLEVDESHEPSRGKILARYRRDGLQGMTTRRMGRSLLRGIVPWAPVEPWTSEAARELYAGGASLVILILVLALFCMNFSAANQNLAGSSWSTSWLLTFPIPTRSLLIARLVEFSLVQVAPWLVLLPVTWQLLRKLDAPAPLALAVGATVVVAFAIGALRLWAETWLRLRCSLRALRSIQGVCSVGAVILIMSLLGIVLREDVPTWFLDLSGAMPTAIAWLPGSWVLGVAQYGVGPAALGLCVTALLVAGSIVATSRLLAHGSMAGGGVDSGRGSAGRWRSRRALGVTGKDLVLLARDRNFMAQTIAVPIVIVVFQLAINPGLDRLGGAGFALVGYGVGLMAGLGGCFQVLIAEGKGLWMLYSLPIDLGVALRRKVALWGGLAVGFVGIAVVALRVRADAAAPLPLVMDFAWAGLGVFCAAHIAGAIGVLGSQPTAEHVSRAIKVRYVYLHLFLGGFYLIVLATPSLPVKISGALAFATLAGALWQRARLRLDDLLDPVVAPRAGLSTLDGAVGLFVFILVQTICLVVALGRSLRVETLDFDQLLLCFVISGAVALLAVTTVAAFQERSFAAELGLRFPGRRRALRWSAVGIGAGALLGAIGLGYVSIGRRYLGIEDVRAADGSWVSLALLAVVAAPLVEELLFRGLLFGGMRRTLTVPVAALWSSAVFASVHPVASWPPVFLVGLGCALLYARSGWIVAPMLLHAAYNLVVVLGG